MDIIGKVIFDLGERKGKSAKGNDWRAHEYVLETQDTYPRKVHFDFFGDRVDQYPLAVGDNIKLSFDIESREYNGRWFTSIRGFRAEKIGAAATPGAVPPPPAGPATTFPGGYGAPAAPADLSAPASTGEDNLPF